MKFDMARGEGVQITFDADAESLRRAIDEITSEIKKIKSEGKKLTDAERQRVDVLKEQLKVYQEQEKALNKVKSQSQQVGTSIARIAQDLPFGITGIGNNITFLVEQLENIQRNAKAAGQSLTAFQIIGQGLTQLFTSPSGLISLIVSLATIFKNAFAPAVEELNKAFTRLTDNLGITDSKFAAFIDKYKERAKEFIKINKQEPKPFAPTSESEIQQEIKRYEKTIEDLDKFISSRRNQKGFGLSPNFAFLNLLYSDEEIKRFQQRREILTAELNALKESLVEFQVEQRKGLSLRATPDVTVGKPFTRRDITTFEPQDLKARRKTVEQISKELIQINPELQPIEAISSLNIFALELAVERLTQKVKAGDTSLVPKLKAFKAELEKKLVEAGLKDARGGQAEQFTPEFIGFDAKTLAKVVAQEAADEKRLRSLVSPAKLQQDEVSENERTFLRQQSAIARASQLFSLAREASALGQTATAEKLLTDAENVLARAGINDLGIAQRERAQLQLQTQAGQFAVGFAGNIGASLAQFFTLQDAIAERERELSLQRLELAKRDNAAMEEEMRRSYRQRLDDVDRLLSLQQITDEEAAARKRDLESERLREEESFALKRRELALQEEELLKANANSVLKQTIANAGNFAVQFVFKALANDPAFVALGLFGAITAAIVAPVLIAGLQSVIESSVRSFAEGGVVKQPTLAVVGDARKSNNRTNEEVIFNERLLTRQAERFASLVAAPVIVINGRKMNDELSRSERIDSVVRVR